ncbi:TLD-domain-containing protein [Cladochytrium replicatum]|nr:TLD-domain-containing protein [Cladochytrium replicatum]
MYSWFGSSSSSSPERSTASLSEDSSASPNRHVDILPPPPVRLDGRKYAEDAILTQSVAEFLRAFLPPLQRESSRWQLIYSTNEHGISLATLYGSAERHNTAMMLVAKDENGHIFGAFASHRLAPAVGFFGNGSCFLFSVNPKTKSVKVYPSTGRNDYQITCDPNYIAFGAGTGVHGLMIDQSLLKGTSDYCVTYDNECLASSTSFECMGVELFVFQI